MKTVNIQFEFEDYKLESVHIKLLHSSNKYGIIKE